MENKNDIIVVDLEKYPQIEVWGEKLGGNLGLEYFYLDDQYFDYIPQHVNYLRFDNKTGLFGHKYWGEIRFQRSEYGVDDQGTTQKDKVKVDNDIRSKYTVPFMKAVITLKIQEIFEKRYNKLRDKYSYLEEATWEDQVKESKAYLEDNTTETKLIHRLAELRGLTLEVFAAKVVKNNSEWKDSVYDLLVKEQSLIVKVKSCVNILDLNVFLEDYFGNEMPREQCLDYGRCEFNETGAVVRKEPFVYGIKF
tara:strand:+ start:163 stop:915 length:753 start_codon:yes stop_codon:yes gene_type:complete